MDGQGLLDGRGCEGNGGVGPTLDSYLCRGGVVGASAAAVADAGEAGTSAAAATGAGWSAAGGGEEGLT